MDAKQADLLQRTLQFAIDEVKRATEAGEDSRFDMAEWMTIDQDFIPPSRRRKINCQDVTIYENIEAGACGTSACLAGTATLLHGGVGVARVTYTDTSIANWVIDLKTDELKPIESHAAEILGLAQEDASALFHMTGHDLEEIVSYAIELAADEGHELEVIW